MKKCKKCLNLKDFDEFYKRKRNKDGYNSSCKVCVLLQQKQYVTVNPEKKREANKKYRLKNTKKIQETQKKWGKENPEKLRAYKKKWRDNNPNKCKRYWENYNSRRDFKVRSRRCSWANSDKINEMYRECRKISRVSGVKHHVDHIIPLCGKNVSGLHHEDNLQIIPAIDNLIKSNKVV